MAMNIHQHRPLFTFAAVTFVVASLVVAIGGATAQTGETPRRGGVLLAAIAADAPSLDPHQENTFATIQPTAPL